MPKTIIQNAPREGTPITGEPEIMHDIDITPKVHYGAKGMAVRIEIYYIVNETSLAVSSVGISANGYTESRFNEHRGIDDPSDRVVPRSRLETLDTTNPHTIPILRVLGETRDVVKYILIGTGNSAYHIELSE